MTDKQLFAAIPLDAQTNVAMGVPSGPANALGCIIARHQYVVGYNKQLNVANWVSWNYNESWRGKSGRSKFTKEIGLPTGYTPVATGDYTNSGFDRGHICPSEQRSNSAKNNVPTFYMSNVFPQTPDLNQGVWRDMESWCVKMSRDSGKELYIIAGGIYHTKELMADFVGIPDSCFKIVVVLNEGEGLADVTSATRIEAVIMPNEEGVRAAKWRSYKRTVKQIEASTGLDFLSGVGKAMQDVIESR